MQENNPELCLERPAQEQEPCAERLISAWTGDIGFVLDRLEQLNASDPSGRFTGRLDLTRVGVFGHSFGGATAAQFCHEDPRCKAGIDVDGAPHGSVIGTGIDRPFMFLLSDHADERDAQSREIMAHIQSIYDHSPADRTFRIRIRGANHFFFSDDAALLKSHMIFAMLRRVGVLGLHGRRQLSIAAYLIRTFFDGYLKGPRAPRPDFPSPLYPEIEVLND
jgi:predicted dienelactone hydrolase